MVAAWDEEDVDIICKV